MERLTERVEDYVRIKGCKTLYDKEERREAPTCSAIARLAMYEDAGLTPEETKKAFEAEHYLANLAANLRNRLKMYEDIGLTPEEISKLKSPCDLCIYGPQSAGDGNPCLVCPACGKGEENAKKPRRR